MLKIKPNIEIKATCPHCQNYLSSNGVLWQGIHVCYEATCSECNTAIVGDLPVGHADPYSFQVDLEKGILFGGDLGRKELGEPLFDSLQNPAQEAIEIKKEVFKELNKVIILNCIDCLYGHSLLKLLNAQRHLEVHPELGLIAIVPQLLRWMVPDGVAEIWTVNLPLKRSKLYFPVFDRFVREECQRFEEIYVSKAYSHPGYFDISRFTKVAKHNFESPDFRITFIWREDRLLLKQFSFKLLKKLGLVKWGFALQNRRIVKVFSEIKKKIPKAKFSVTGLGTSTKFPDWIDDKRVTKFDEKTERKICEIYAESRLVIGIHGSNMLLPSAHAGMTIDLMPTDRWGNFAQDILYQEEDPRFASFRYLYLPLSVPLKELGFIAGTMVQKRQHFYSNMAADKRK
ncbi:hypothetical protein [Oxynema aestuarii]|uniref:Uncharacterized protein n=1 Tax=Oxynema aestuarii AP17 TaxID=2064643 RepID=A0A6H1U1R5_9CYAN|nr:hypothetical protein [Oxynema aestuarii]QIZ71559.1 hypothetical protein HCG48_14000 [Oxynema aestuarii AP17]